MKTHTVQIVITTLVVLSSFSTANGARWFVRAAGNDQADGMSAHTAFRTIQRAAQAQNHGDDIVIGPGVYRETVLLAERASADAKTMSVLGDENGKLTGDAAGPVVLEAMHSTTPALRFFRFRNLRVAGLTVRGSGRGIEFDRCQQVIIERSTFDGLGGGLFIRGSKDVRVESCVFARATIGLFMKDAVNTRIAHVTVAGSTSVGILILSCGAGEIRNSILTENNTNLIGDAVSAATWTSDFNATTGTHGAWGAVPVIANGYEWTAASDQDRHSVHVAPAFVDPEKYDLRISPQVSWEGGLPGMRIGKRLEPSVERDRDGRPFRAQEGRVCTGAYDYPDPQPAAGWLKLAGGVTGDEPRQSAAIYRDNTLIRTLLADASGVKDLWWDGLDDLGQSVGGGTYIVKTITHDARLVDDGSIGDNGNPLGAYNCDNADRVVILPDGSFVITTAYDEAGFPLRQFTASGQPVFAAALAEKDFTALALAENDLYGLVGKGNATGLVRLVLPGDRSPMNSGAESYAVFFNGDKPGNPVGLNVGGGKAFTALSGIDVVRVIDLATGKKLADWPVAGVGDLARDPQGTLWAISGTDIVSLNSEGKSARRFPTGLGQPRFLAAGVNRLAAVDRKASKIAILDAADGKVVKTLGRDRATDYWSTVGGDTFRDPRGVAWLTDGKLLVTEHARVRALWPESGRVAYDLVSNFMETAVVHPMKAEWVYCGLGIFHVDPKSGGWTWRVETPAPPFVVTKEEDPWAGKRLGSPTHALVLGGRPFIAYHSDGTLTFFDVSDPLKPRAAGTQAGVPGIYSTAAFGKGGDLVMSGMGSLTFKLAKFIGLDGSNNPKYDIANLASVGRAADPIVTRSMSQKGGLSCDPNTGDLYYLAVTNQHNKMVPAWGADGTGIGKSSPDGRPLWFSLSSGGNYSSVSTARDAKQAWTLAAKSFGGQIDVFDEDGLRLTTGNWGWPSHYAIGFVDLRYGVHAYLRPDGKIGAYVEDDAVGRFARCRLDGAETVKRSVFPLEWKQESAPAASLLNGEAAQPRRLSQLQEIPRVAELQVDGEWAAWSKRGVVPQIVALPTVGFKRTVPDDLWQTFRAGACIGALAHDGKHLYTYFLVTDDTPHFDSTEPSSMWMYDGIELWLEEEQFGLGFIKDGTPSLFKYRYHNLEGKEWSANYALPRDHAWGAKVADLSQHPLGKQLSALTGVSFEDRGGYALMGKIPMSEVKLVGGIAGRTGKDILNMTGVGSPGTELEFAL